MARKRKTENPPGAITEIPSTPERRQRTARGPSESGQSSKPTKQTRRPATSQGDRKPPQPREGIEGVADTTPKDRDSAGKIVLPSKFREWEGIDRVVSTVHEMKCIFRELSKDDFGIDGEIEIVLPKPDGQGYEARGGIIKVQVKSGTSYITRDSPTTFASPVEMRDLKYWHGSNVPVLYIVNHVADGRLYWKDLKSYVRSTPSVFQPPLQIVFDKAHDEFTPSSYDRLCAIANSSPPRIASDLRERLFSNLFLVKRLPPLLTHAPTSFKTANDVYAAVEGFVPPFVLVEGHIYTLSDLRDRACSLRSVCDTNDVNDANAVDWISDHARRSDYVVLLNKLFGKHLRRCGLSYNRDTRKNYFPRENDSSAVFKRDWYNVRTSKPAPARIVVRHYTYGHDDFWRHLAISWRFRQLGASWYLQVIPKYFFSSDGVSPYDSDRVGPLTTKIKARERNMAVLNHVLFWADVLSQHKPSIEVMLDNRKLLEIEKSPTSGVADFAIPGDPAIYDEDEAATAAQPSLWFDDEGELDDF